MENIYEEERDLVTFSDDEGNEFSLEVMDYFEYEGQEYAVLCQLEEDVPEGTDTEVYIMKVSEEGEDEIFLPADEDKMDELTQIVEKMLDGIPVKTDTDYFSFIKENPDIAEKTVFTGMIDEYFSYQLGALQYRSVRFETEVLNTDNYQGNAVVNYTRIIEHKHFEFGMQEKTVISREYSLEWKVGMEPYYPVNDEQNNRLFEQYQELAKKERNVIFGGRLGSYKYYDMDKVIEAALNLCREELTRG